MDQCIGAVNIDGWRTWLGNARYDVCILWGIIKGRTETEGNVTLKMDGELVSNHVSNFSVQHTQHVGKGLRVCPLAYWNDGLADIMVLISRPNRTENLRSSTIP